VETVRPNGNAVILTDTATFALASQVMDVEKAAAGAGGDQIISRPFGINLSASKQAGSQRQQQKLANSARTGVRPAPRAIRLKSPAAGLMNTQNHAGQMMFSQNPGSRVDLDRRAHHAWAALVCRLGRVAF